MRQGPTKDQVTINSPLGRTKGAARNETVDYLRTIGVFAIVLAHIASPYVLHQIRNFDVPLMVMLSGISYGLSARQPKRYATFAWRRIKRLIFPVWVFLTLFFVASYVLGSGSGYSSKTIIDSYILNEGIGYVWIIRVFLIASLAAPFVARLIAWIGNAQVSLAATLMSLVVISIGYLSLPVALQNFVVDNYFVKAGFSGLLYGHAFVVGMLLLKLPRKHTFAVGVGLLMSYACLACVLYLQTGNYVSTQAFKYPPTFYYLSYAIGVSLVLYTTLRVEQLVLPPAMRSFLLFVARNSIWIYLWHIAVIKVLNPYGLHWALKYPAVLGVAIAVTYAQRTLLETVVFPRVKSERLARNIKVVLTG